MPTEEVIFARQFAVGTGLILLLFSLFLKPTYEIDKVGLATPYVLV